MRMDSGAAGLSALDDPAAAAQLATRGNRRRLSVFAGVFLLCLAVGMAWNLLRPAEYRALARLQLTLPPVGVAVPASGPAAAGDAGADFMGQVKRLASRPLLEQVVLRLEAMGQRIEASDAASHLQSLIAVTPVPGSTVIELSATGSPPQLLAAALNELMAVFRQQLASSYSSHADERLEQTRDEVARLEQLAGQRRAQLDRYRGGSGILSPEREENEAVARTRGLANALNTAVEKQATAEARLRALEDAVKSGQGATTARDDPTLASLESRASQLREELREMGRVYTEEFLAMDARARSLRTRLAELETQIAQRRVVSQELALAKAQEEVASTRANVERLQAQIAAERQTLGNFSGRFAQAKAMEEDLASIERARREALERLARLEANEKALRPAVEVLQSATPPDSPWRPNYLRDGGFVAAGAFLLALAAMGFVELFNRPPRPASVTPMTVVLPSTWPPLASPSAMPAIAPVAVDALPAPAPAPIGAALPAPTVGELTQAEAAALLAAAHGAGRLACTGWLMGLDTPELTALRHADLDRLTLRLRVRGPWAREVAVPPWFANEVGADTAPGDALLLRNAVGQPVDESQLQTLLACAAIDAGLPDGATMSPERLRFTAMSWWVAEGLRFSDLPALAGRIDAQTVTRLARFAGGAPRRGAGEIDPLMPALRLAPPA
jgi:uncharacterized protein involved in exopolysaccharide biosynthesis